MDVVELSLHFNGTDIVIPFTFIQYASSYKLEMEWEGTKVLFEPDEERNWRALVSYEDIQANKKPDKNLLELICMELNTIFNNG